VNEHAGTEAELVREIAALKRKIRELEQSETGQRQAAQTLRESLERCRTLLSESPDPTFSFNSEGRYLFVNRAFAEGVGKPVEALVGRTIWDAFPKEEADKRFASLSQVFRTGEGRVVEVRVPRADGDRHYLTTISPIKDAQGSVLSAVCSSKDITEHKRAEKALEESRERYQALSEAAFEAIFISEHGHCIEQNTKAEQMFGYSHAEVVGRDMTKGVAPQDRDLVMQHIRSGFEEPYEATALRKDGTTFPALICARMMHYQGRNVRVTSLRDITEQKKTESTLRESEARLKKLLEFSPISMAIVGMDGTIEYINRRAIETFGYLPEDIPTMERWWVKAYPDETYREEVITRWMGLVEKALAGNGEIERREYQVTCKDGTVKTMVIFGVLVSGKVFVMFEDITDLKLAAEERLSLERQLLHAQKMESLGIMAGGIAHDFNNLLTAILGNADLALAELSPPSTARPLVEQIQTASLRAAELTRQMLVFAGRGELATEPLELSATVREMGELLAASLSKKAELRFDLAKDLPTIEADPTQLRQIIMNFILNASDALGDQPGVIDVRTGRGRSDQGFAPDFSIGFLPPGRDFVFLEVADSGCGIDAVTLPRIFDPFFSTKFAGRGLGLAATQGIILRHSGALFVRSRPGAGSAFRAVFPVPAAAAGAAASNGQRPATAGAPSPRAAERPWWGSGIVLLVDDEAAVRKMTAQMLTLLGFEVVSAADGEEAVALFGARAGEIRAILLDLTMPRMNGLEAFPEFRRLRGDVPVILCSGYDVKQSADQFSDLAFSGFLQKPYRLAELKSVLMKALGS
jgi:PAS domain S-box-containing protein